MKKITDIIQKPSQALRAMIDGLLKADKDKSLSVRMNTFGESDGVICYGCAATYCLMEITGVKPTPDFVRMEDIPKFESIDFDVETTTLFECVIDSARSGEFYGLFCFFGVVDKLLQVDNDRYLLTTFDWKDEIPKVEAHILELQQRGL